MNAPKVFISYSHDSWVTKARPQYAPILDDRDFLQQLFADSK